MKSFTIVCVLAMAGLFTTSLAMADSTQGGGQFGPGQTQNLDSIKQRIEQHIQDHINKMQSILTCVQNAQDRQTLRQCMPKRRGRRHARYGQGQSAPQN